MQEFTVAQCPDFRHVNTIYIYVARLSNHLHSLVSFPAVIRGHEDITAPDQRGEIIGESIGNLTANGTSRPGVIYLFLCSRSLSWRARGRKKEMEKERKSKKETVREGNRFRQVEVVRSFLFWCSPLFFFFFFSFTSQWWFVDHAKRDGEKEREDLADIMLDVKIHPRYKDKIFTKIGK